MTAVAPPPNFQNIARSGWSGPNGTPNGLNSMNAEDYRMFMPRKTVQRSNSASSLSTSASSTSTVTANSQTNGIGPSVNAEGSTWGARKKPTRGLWPTSKTEPISGISTARPQSISTAGPGSSAQSAMSALHSPAPMVPSQHNGASQMQQNGVSSRAQSQENTAILYLIPLNGTFDRKTINVPYYPDVLRIGRQTNNKTIPTPMNGYFDSKVLSRQHAEVWADRANGKIYIRDIKSSNGTFVNGQRLSPENRESEPHELREQDLLELGIDIVSEDQKTVVHHKVAARVEHAGLYSNAGNNLLDLNFGEMDAPQLNMMGPGGQSGMGNVRGRTPSQGSLNGGRLQGPSGPMANNVGAMNQQRHINFWLQPITMEQVVKKLNAEIKSARQQNEELKQTTQFIDSILTADPKKEPSIKSPTNAVKISAIKDLKNRFSDPPAPPPQQPLPEKPDVLLRRETERPKSTSSLGRADSHSQISSLTSALTSARKEIESQGIRLRDLEALLTQEQLARKTAEERVTQLERQALNDTVILDTADLNGTSESEQIIEPSQNESDAAKAAPEPPSLTDAATTRLQQRLEIMVSEMNEMKQQMERYRQRAETAEAENATHRKTLAEMVEKIRQDEATRVSQETKPRRRNADRTPSEAATADSDEFDDVDGEAEEGEITIINERDMDGAGTLFRRKVGLPNGRPISQEDVADVKTSQALQTKPSPKEALAVHAAPAASIIGICLIGMGLMAWLNAYPKVER